MAENALAETRIPQPPGTHIPLAGRPYERQPTPSEQTQDAATPPDQGKHPAETLLNEATRTAGTVLDESGRAVGTVLSEGKRAAGTALDEGGRTGGTTLDEGRRTARRALDEGRRAAGKALDESGRAAGRVLDESGRAAGTALDEGRRVAGSVLDEGRRVAGSVLEQGRREVDGRPRRKSPGTVRPRERGTTRTKGEIAVAAALRHLGVAFSWGGGSATGPTLGIGRGATTRGFDCSGLTLHAWSRAGVKLGHYTGTQFRQGRRVPLADRRPGDLLFFGGGTGDPTHVGLFVRGNLMVHAPKTGDVVRKADFLEPGYFRSSFRGVVRPA
ncbi:C40 family peptidase [Nonomuraea maritima]|uniref:C40 family peptidase n=1 Tax=Nonomuraea maritima TaxID=683260 RepID=UPI003720F271